MDFDAWPSMATSFGAVDQTSLDALIEKAIGSERRRSHLLLHKSHADPVQRLLVAFASGTYIQPHMHSQQWELIVPLSGKLRAMFFADDGTVIGEETISSDATPVFQIPAGVWHVIFPVSETAAIMEVKPGPFRPAEFAPWSPAEGAAAAEEFSRWLGTAKVRNKWSST